MSYSDLTMIKSLARSLHYTARRNRVLSQNIANVDTPEYKARDLTKIRFPKAITRTAFNNDLLRTHSSHFKSTAFQTNAPIVKLSKTDERTISRNTVNLEENLVKINQNSAEHERAVNLYRKYFSFINTATGRGQGR